MKIKRYRMTKRILNIIKTRRESHNNRHWIFSRKSLQLPLVPMCICGKEIEEGDDVISHSKHRINHFKCMEESIIE